MIPHPTTIQTITDMCRWELLASIEYERRAVAATVASSIPSTSPPVPNRVLHGGAERSVARSTTPGREWPLVGLIGLGFVGMGLLEASAGVLWADILRGFSVSEGVFGLAMAIAVALAFPLMVFGGRLVDRIDKRVLLGLAFLLLAAGSLGLAWGTGALALTAILAVRGLGISLTDLSGFALTMDYERDHQRHVMGLVLAGVSIGAMLGPAAVGAIFHLGGSYRTANLAVMAFYLLATLAAVLLVRHRPAAPRRTEVSSPPAFHLLRRPLLRLLAVLCGLGFLAEMLVTQWVGLYLRDGRGLDAGIAVLALGAYAGATLVARLANGVVLARLGSWQTLTADGALALVGGAVMVAGGPPLLGVLGCALAGLGIAGMVPTALSLVGAAFPAATGAATGAALAVGYLAFVLGPATAGAVATAASLQAVITGIAISGGATTLFALRLRGMVQDTHEVMRPDPDQVEAAVAFA